MIMRILKIAETLKSKSGISLLFVLGIMALLMAIGTSVLAAASANTGFALNQGIHNQAMILDDAVHKNIMYSLQHHGESPLWAELLMRIYLTNDPDFSGDAGIDDEIEIKIEFDGDDLDLYDGNVKLESVTVSFPTEWQSVIIDPAIPAYIPEYIPATPTDTDIELPRDRVPKSARMSAEMLVTVRIIIGEGTSRERTVISRATYRYTGGELSDDPDSDHHDNDEPDFSPPMQFVDYGEWRLLRHEKVGS